MPGGKRRHEDDMNFVYENTYVFRDPQDVFREFFDNTPFENLFASKYIIDGVTKVGALNSCSS
jgi:hypothetical protein